MPEVTAIHHGERIAKEGQIRLGCSAIILDKTKISISTYKLAELLDVSKSQLNKWLKKAVEDGFLQKHSRPVRYNTLKKKQSSTSRST